VAGTWGLFGRHLLILRLLFDAWRPNGLAAPDKKGKKAFSPSTTGMTTK
jgi:hypothetical protein